MALKPCRECKKKVSTEAVTCPNCGVPNPTLISKTKKIKPNYGFVRCEKTFCNNKYKLLEIPKNLIDVQECQVCGNKMEKVNNEDAIKYIEQKQVKSQTSKTNNRNISSSSSSNSNGEYFFNGTKSLAKTFWLYFFVGNKVFVLFEYLLLKNEAETPILYFVVILHIIWTALSVMGVFNSANIYKTEKIKRGQTYGYATAAKIATVLLVLSSIGNAL